MRTRDTRTSSDTGQDQRAGASFAQKCLPVHVALRRLFIGESVSTETHPIRAIAVPDLFYLEYFSEFAGGEETP